MRVAIADNSGQPHHFPHMLLLLVVFSSFFLPKIIPLSLCSHTNAMVGLWLYRRLPAHYCRNHHMAALLTALLVDQVRQILRTYPLWITFPMPLLRS